MKTSEKINLIAAALIAAQSGIEKAVKSSKNPYFNSDYADLEACLDAVKPALMANKISLMQFPSTDIKDVHQLINGKEMIISIAAVKIKTTLLHESGQFISHDFTLYSKTDSQAIGSAITYGRRYSLSSMLSLATTDDDGNIASKSFNGVPIISQDVNGEEYISLKGRAVSKKAIIKRINHMSDEELIEAVNEPDLKKIHPYFIGALRKNINNKITKE